MKMFNDVPEYVLHWEAYDQLYYKGEIEALIKLQKEYVRKHPDDQREKLLLADAYCYGDKYHQALKILKELHKYDPYDTEFSDALVTCLDKLDIDPKTFKWKRKFLIFEEATLTLEWCYKYLKQKRSQVDVLTLIMALGEMGHVRFDEDQLVEYLNQDHRFDVGEITGELYEVVTLASNKVVNL